MWLLIHAWIKVNHASKIYLLLNTTPHTMFETALAISSWQLNGLLLYLVNSSVRTSISSMHFSSIGDFPTPKSRMIVMANFLVNCQSWRLKMMPLLRITLLVRGSQSGRWLKISDFSTRASLTAFGPLSTTAVRWPNRKRNTSPYWRLKIKGWVLLIQNSWIISNLNTQSVTYANIKLSNMIHTFPTPIVLWLKCCWC